MPQKARGSPETPRPLEAPEEEPPAPAYVWLDPWREDRGPRLMRRMPGRPPGQDAAPAGLNWHAPGPWP